MKKLSVLLRDKLRRQIVAPTVNVNSTAVYERVQAATQTVVLQRINFPVSGAVWDQTREEAANEGR